VNLRYLIVFAKQYSIDLPNIPLACSSAAPNDSPVYNTQPTRDYNEADAARPKAACAMSPRRRKQNFERLGIIVMRCGVLSAWDVLRLSETEMNILLIGCGKMGGAMLRQWASNDDNRFTVADPAASDFPEGVAHVSKATSLPPAAFDVVLIAIKPQMIATVLPDYAFALKSDGCFVSIAAGCSIDTIAGIVGEKAIIRVMPNLAAMVGLGVSGLCANTHCTAQQKADVTGLIAETGTCIQLSSEDEIDRLTAVSGSGPGYIFEVMRSYVAAAMALGFDEQTARSLVFDTITGTVETARQSPETLEDLRNSVTSKNGTTQAGLAELMRGGSLDALFQDTVQAAYSRAAELK
jgi:pyrroline-5-carboxylate reductase